MMGTRHNSEPSVVPPLSNTQSSLRSRLKKLSKDLELATGQTLQLKAQLDQSEKKVGVLNSIVRSLRKELQGHSPFASFTKSPSNETLCSEVSSAETPESRQGNVSPSVQQQFEAQIRSLQLQRDQEREKAQALELELFETLEVMEKSFHVNSIDHKGSAKDRLVQITKEVQYKDTRLSEVAREMHDLELELLATRELLADQEDAHLKGRREWEEMINNVMKDPKKALKDHWIPDAMVNECQYHSCTKQFGLFTRKHHCRRCGLIFCQLHSSHQMRLALLDLKPAETGVPVRVCDGCFDEFTM